VRYTPTTDQDRAAMLAAIGVDSVDALFEDIPGWLRFTGRLAIPPALSEPELLRDLGELAGRNASFANELSFLGAGMYDHHVPSVVEWITGRSEFQTAYTPYQPEVSQGTLTAIFEFQTAISELTGLPVANASMYDGPTAAAEAVAMAVAHTGRKRVLVARAVHPHTRGVIETFADGLGYTVEEVPHEGGLTDHDALRGALGDDVACLLLQQPNFLGCLEDAPALVEAVHAAGALAVVAADPTSLGLLEAPGRYGADVCVGEGQALGNHPAFGGPSFGFFAATEALIRRMPGRIVGETTDVDGRRGFVLTLQTREQHIRREKATSNICTAQALNALGGVVYLSWLGRQGIVELGELLLQRTHYAREALCAIDGVEPWHTQPVVREFAVTLPVPVEGVVQRCAAEGVNPGLALPEENALLVAITELRSREEIDKLADVLSRAVVREAVAA
jgi:glycine dehydrogenase subunit 1